MGLNCVCEDADMVVDPLPVSAKIKLLQHAFPDDVVNSYVKQNAKARKLQMEKIDAAKRAIDEQPESYEAHALLGEALVEYGKLEN